MKGRFNNYIEVLWTSSDGVVRRPLGKEQGRGQRVQEVKATRNAGPRSGEVGNGGTRKNGGGTMALQLLLGRSV